MDGEEQRRGRRPRWWPAGRTRSAPTTIFDRARTAARNALDDPARLRAILDDAEASGARRSGPFEQLVGEFLTLTRLVRAYAKGDYRDIPRDRLLIIVAALAYVASPIDLIPDALPGGFIDDAAVVFWVLRQVHSEVAAFREWELSRERGASAH